MLFSGSHHIPILGAGIRLGELGRRLCFRWRCRGIRGVGGVRGLRCVHRRWLRSRRNRCRDRPSLSFQLGPIGRRLLRKGNFKLHVGHSSGWGGSSVGTYFIHVTVLSTASQDYTGHRGARRILISSIVRANFANVIISVPHFSVPPALNIRSPSGGLQG